MYRSTSRPGSAAWTSAFRKWMPAQMRASSTSFVRSEKRWKTRCSPGNRPLVAKNVISSVPKNDANACIAALAIDVAPEGWSGYGGVISAGCETPPIAGSSDGSNSGVHVGSATVAGLASLSACRIAVIGRQKFQWYLSFHAAISASAELRSSRAKSRALSLTSSENCSTNRRAIAL